MTRLPRRFLAGGALVALVLVLGAYALRGQILALGAVAAARALGYGLSYGAITATNGHLAIDRPDLKSNAGEPVFTAQRIDLAYDLGKIFGSPHPFGLTGVDIERPKLTYIRHRDGTANITLPASNGSKSSATFALPEIRLAIHDGSVGILDDTRIFAHSRRIALENLQVDANLAPSAISRLALSLTLLDHDGKFPITGRGTLDEGRGIELTRITAKTIGLSALLDYALNSTALHIANGVLSDVDARIYGLNDRLGVMQRHIGVTANLDHFQPYLNGIAKPLRDGRGALRVYDRGLTFPKIDGSIAGVPVRIAGGIFDLSDPTLRLGITGNGDLRRLITLSDAAKKFPISGPLAFKLFVEGAATQPLTLATFSSPHLQYAGVPIKGLDGAVALHGPQTAILRSALAYDGIDAGARGVITLGKHTDLDLVASLAAPARRVPYANDVLGNMLVNAVADVRGTDAKLQTSGVVNGANATTRLAGTFAVNGAGVGDIGPLTIEGPGNRSLYARVALDRPHAGGGAAFVALRNFYVSTSGSQPSLPGLKLAALPPISGTLDGAIAASLAGKNVLGGGDFHLHDVRARGYPIDDLAARGNVLASTGNLAGARVDADVRYRGALAPIARAAGGTIKATGRVDLPIAIVALGSRTVLAQIHDARFTNASVNGVAIRSLAGTVGVRGGTRIDVYGVQAAIAGGDVVAQGSFGNGGTLDVSTAGFDLRALASLGLPIRSGAVDVVATIGGTAHAPHLEGGIAASDVTLANRQAAGLPVNGSSGLSYANGTLGISNAIIAAGPAIAALDGTVSGLRGNPRDARYAFAADLRQADIATLARIAHANRQYPQGTLNANVRIAGVGSSPGVAGTIGIPEGSINGLRFRDASVRLAGTANNIHAERGAVTVGESKLGFSADYSRATASLSIDAPHVDLSDFNDYFDPGDVLGGTGSIAIAASNAPDRLTTSGRVRIAHARVKRFDIGQTNADWSTSGRTIHTAASVGGAAGVVTEHGDITLASTTPLRDALHRTNLDLAARATGVNLAVWLPAAQVQAPVLGLIDANATVHGVYPNEAIVAHAALHDGLVARVPIRTAAIDARTDRGRAMISSAVFAIDNLRAHASGYLSLTPTGPLDLTVVANTSDVAALSKSVTGKTFDGAGAVSTSAHVTGAPGALSVSDIFDADKLRYQKLVVPHAHAEFTLVPGRATLARSEIDLTKGRLLAAGFAPLRSNFAGIVATRPLALDFTAERIDLAQFADLAPKGTTIAGLLDGRVGLVGSLDSPGLSGAIALTNGAFVGPAERSKISDFNANLAFAGRTVTLQKASAKIGGGDLAATGHVSVLNLRAPADTAQLALNIVSNYAVFDIPNLFRGRINGNLDVARAAGGPLAIDGKLDISSARIATAALIPKPATTTSGAGPLPVAFNLAVNAGNDVRVQGGPVDIGAKGDLLVGGTLAAPTVRGMLTSTGGTLSFYRTFRIQYPSTVTFYPSNGVIPNVDAMATTTVDNPTTDVNLHVTGPATQLNVDLTSDPAYSRQQILGLLVGAQAFGAVSGIASSNTTGAQANPFTALAEGQLGNLLTQNILEPFSSQIGSAIGLNNLEINYQPGGSLGLGAQKQIFKNVNAVFAQSFNYPPRQTIGIRATPNRATAYQFTVFSQPQSNRYQIFQPANVLSSNESVTSSQPANGTNGISFSFQRKF